MALRNGPDRDRASRRSIHCPCAEAAPRGRAAREARRHGCEEASSPIGEVTAPGSKLARLPSGNLDASRRNASRYRRSPSRTARGTSDGTINADSSTNSSWTGRQNHEGRSADGRSSTVHASSCSTVRSAGRAATATRNAVIQSGPTRSRNRAQTTSTSAPVRSRAFVAAHSRARARGSGAVIAHRPSVRGECAAGHFDGPARRPDWLPHQQEQDMQVGTASEP